MVEQLNKRIKQGQHPPIPEGYVKIKEKMPVYDYKVPEEYHQVEKGTEKAICISVIDQMLSDAFGIHILEPTVTFKEVELIRPNLTKAAAKKIQRASESSEKG